MICKCTRAYVKLTLPSLLLQTIPVYSVSDSEDWRIRGYSKCPAYQKRLTAWLNSDAFKQKEQDTQQLRQQIQDLAPQLNTSLAMWYVCASPLCATS